MLIDEIIIKLDRFWQGEKPDYSITIYGDGKVIYDGRKNVSKTGIIESNISKEDVVSLLYDFKNSDFFSLNKDFLSNPAEDVNNLSISLPVDKENIKTNKISFNENSQAVPDSVKSLSNKIDEITGSFRWIQNGESINKTASNKASSIKSFNNYFNNKKVIVGVVGIVAVLVVLAAIFSSGVFDSKDNSIIDDGGSDTGITNGDSYNGNNNGIANEDADSVLEFSIPVIQLVVTTDNDVQGCKTPLNIPEFLEGDEVFIYFKYYNVVHNSSYAFYQNISIDGVDFENEHFSEYDSIFSDDASFCWVFNFSTTDWNIGRYIINVSIKDIISNKHVYKYTSFKIVEEITSDLPYVSISANPVEGTKPLEVIFNSQGYNFNDTLQYLWEFGDQNISTQQNPMHTYTNEGTYEVIITVTDTSENTAYNSTEITVYENSLPLNAQIVSVEASGSNQVTFEGSVSGGSGEHTYHWNFTKNGVPVGYSTSLSDTITLSDKGVIKVVFSVFDGVNSVLADAQWVLVS